MFYKKGIRFMNVYDFDKTIYDGDSTLDFYFFCLKKKPTIAIKLPMQVLGFIMYKLKKINKVQFKEKFFLFLNDIPNIEEYVRCFWNENDKKIKKWYIEQYEENDLIVSASPYFLLQEGCRRLNIKHLIASEVDPNTGKFNSDNCYGINKLERFNEVYPSETINQFYSDCYSDTPLAEKAKQAYIVNKNNVEKWNWGR